MQTQRLATSSAPSQKRVVSIFLVAAIHLIVIYGLIVTLKPIVFNAPPPGPITVLPTKSTPPPPEAPTDIQVTLRNPGMPQIPRTPVITTVPGDVGPTYPRSSGADTRLPPQIIPSLVPVRGIVGTHTIPGYPPIAARLNEQGSVRLELQIDERGYVIDAQVLTSSGYSSLDAAAVNWVKDHWRYQPALRDGTPVPASTDAVVMFRLTDRRG